MSDQLAVGLGIFVPYGLGTKWPETFEGRFSGYDNDLRSIYIQPTVAFSPIPDVRIGGGVDFVSSKVKLTQRLDLFEQAVPGVPGAIIGQLGIPRNTEFADAALESDHATGIGAHVGITIDLHERFSVGARYLSQVSLDYEGAVDFTQIPTGIILPDGTVFGSPGPLPVDTVVAGLMAPGGALADQAVTTSITMPAQFVVGFAVKLLDNLTFLADYQLTQWSVFDTLTINFANGGSETLVEDYENTNGFRTGLDWSPGTGGTIRVGYLWHEAAAPAATVTPLLPEGARNEITVGYGLRLSEGLGVDAAYQYIRQNDRRGRMRSPLEGEDPLDLNAGLYQFRAHLFGVTVNLSF